MRQAVVWALFGAVLACGCGSFEPGPPVVLAITPGTMPGSEPTRVEVVFSALNTGRADYDFPTVRVDRGWTVTVGAQTLATSGPTGGYTVDTHASGSLLTLFPVGNYNVRVDLGDGRTSTVANGFEVTAGDWPTGYAFDGIGSVKRGVPVDITLRAQGSNAASFHGQVTVSASGPGAGSAPAEVVTFDAGVSQFSATLGGTGSAELVASDVAGHTGSSNGFEVKP